MIQEEFNIQQFEQVLTKCLNLMRESERFSYEMAFDELLEILYIKILLERHHQKKLSPRTFAIDDFWWENHDFIVDGGIFFENLFSYLRKIEPQFFINNTLFNPWYSLRISKATFLEIIGQLEHFFLGQQAINNAFIGFDIAKIFPKYKNSSLRIPDEIVHLSQFIWNFLKTVIQKNNHQLKICDTFCTTSDFLLNFIDVVLKQNYAAYPIVYHSQIYDIAGFSLDITSLRTLQINLLLRSSYSFGRLCKYGEPSQAREFQTQTFDFVFAAPPFGVRLAPQQYDDLLKNHLNSYYPIHQDIISEDLFLKYSLALLNKDGVLITLLPESYITSSKFKKDKYFIEKNIQILFILSLPNNIFKGANIKTSLVVLKKTFRAESNYHIPIAQIFSKDIENDIIRKTTFSNLLHKFETYYTENPLYLLGTAPRATDITTIQYKNLESWSIEGLDMPLLPTNGQFQLVPIKNILTQKKVYVPIKDEELYTRITVKLRGEGVALRDQVQGKEMQLKKQFLVRKGQFVVSRIAANQGGFGIVPEELDNAIVTHEFLVFDFNNTQQPAIKKFFFEAITQNPTFWEYCQQFMVGSVMQRLPIEVFLNIKIPVPPIEIQAKIVSQKQEIKNALSRIEKLKKDIQSDFDNLIFQKTIPE